MSERELVSAAIGKLLFNVANFPDNVQTRLLGQDLGPLRVKLTDAVMGALAKAEPVQIDRDKLADFIASERDKFPRRADDMDSEELADAVIAYLAAQPSADQQVRAVQGWMALDLHMALGHKIDMRAEVKNQGWRSWADWWADLCGEVRALAAQPVTGTVCTCGWGGQHDPDNSRCDKNREVTE